MKKVIFIVLALIIILVGGFFFFSQDKNNGTVGTDGASSGEINGGKMYNVEITANGYSPKELEINKGDKVTWINKNSEEHWPASAVHPTHSAYPGSGAEKCGTSEQSRIFDACGGLAPGENWSFVFNEIGSWKYHDHLNLENTGKIIVK